MSQRSSFGPRKLKLPQVIDRNTLEKESDEQIRRYARHSNLASQLNRQEMLDALFEHRPLLPVLTKGRSFRKGIFEGDIIISLGLQKSQRLVEEKTADCRMDPHKDIILQHARIAEAGPSRLLPPGAATPSPHSSPKQSDHPSTSRRLKRKYNGLMEESPAPQADETLSADMPFSVQPASVPLEPTPEGCGVQEPAEIVSTLGSAGLSANNFPIERFPSPPADVYSDDERILSGEDVEQDDEEFSTGHRDSPALVDFVYPPPAPLDAADPHWVTKMLTDLERQRNNLEGELEDVRTDLQATVADACLARAELDEECGRMQRLLNALARIVGREMVQTIIEDAEHFAEHGPPPDDHEDGGHPSEGESDGEGHDSGKPEAVSRAKYSEPTQGRSHQETNYFPTTNHSGLPFAETSNTVPPRRSKRARSSHELGGPEVQGLRESGDGLRPKFKRARVDDHNHPASSSSSSKLLKRRRNCADDDAAESVFPQQPSTTADVKGKAKAVDDENGAGRHSKRTRRSRYHQASDDSFGPERYGVGTSSSRVVNRGKEPALSFSSHDSSDDLDTNSSSLALAIRAGYPGFDRTGSSSVQASQEAGPSMESRIGHPSHAKDLSSAAHMDASIAEPTARSHHKLQDNAPRKDLQNRCLRRNNERVQIMSNGDIQTFHVPRPLERTRDLMERHAERRYNPELDEWEVHYPDEEVELRPRPRIPYNYDKDLAYLYNIFCVLALPSFPAIARTNASV